MRPVTTRMTYIGLAVVAVGFAVILFTWGEVAGLANVALQLPYLVSGGLVGIGLVLTGLTTVVVSVLQQDTATRDRELLELREAVMALRAALDGDHVATSEAEVPFERPTVEVS